MMAFNVVQRYICIFVMMAYLLYIYDDIFLFLCICCYDGMLLFLFYDGIFVMHVYLAPSLVRPTSPRSGDQVVTLHRHQVVSYYYYYYYYYIYIYIYIYVYTYIYIYIHIHMYTYTINVTFTITTTTTTPEPSPPQVCRRASRARCEWGSFHRRY